MFNPEAPVTPATPEVPPTPHHKDAPAPSPASASPQPNPLITRIAPKSTVTITPIRSLADSIHDIAGTILFEAGFTQSLIDRSEVVEIFRFLEDCKEEGRQLYPDILLTTNLETCLEGVHPKRLITSGECTDRPGRFKRALKKCASISTEPWVIALEVSKEKVKYGFVSADIRADSIPLYEAILEARTAMEAPPPVVFLRRFGTKAIWIKSPKIEQIISLTLSEELLKANEHINTFSKIIVEELPPLIREKSLRLVTRLVHEACREGHGFIACAVKSDGISVQKCQAALPDGSWLNPTIDLAASPIESENAAAALESDSKLRANAALARRMIEMDLMTMFSTDGCVIGYNIHIPSPHGATLTGGARTRAFAALKTNDAIRAAFMCSQDGQTQFLEFDYSDAK